MPHCLVSHVAPAQANRPRSSSVTRPRPRQAQISDPRSAETLRDVTSDVPSSIAAAGQRALRQGRDVIRRPVPPNVEWLSVTSSGLRIAGAFGGNLFLQARSLNAGAKRHPILRL